MDDPQWSPDGKKIIATATINEQQKIYIMNPDDSNLEPLTPPDIRAIHGSWSSDSKQVIFVPMTTCTRHKRTIQKSTARREERAC